VEPSSIELVGRAIPRVRHRGLVKKEELAYIAGFLDGDGCIMLQLVYRRDYILGYQIRASIVFYQKQQNNKYLEWLRSKLKYGYLRDRKDGMSEYTIVGVAHVSEVLNRLRPYLKLKEKHAKIALKVLGKMPGTGRKMTAETLLKLSRYVDMFADLNYSKRRTNVSGKIKALLISRKLLGSRRD